MVFNIGFRGRKRFNACVKGKISNIEAIMIICNAYEAIDTTLAKRITFNHYVIIILVQNYMKSIQNL